jgi:hypothetical protein
LSRVTLRRFVIFFLNLLLTCLIRLW